jgi:hypothetical protein
MREMRSALSIRIGPLQTLGWRAGNQYAETKDACK